MGKWTDEQMFKFVQLYGYNSCLWDTTSPAYKSKDCRQVALKAIVDDMDIPGFGTSECKIKIKNMRSHYCQELRKVKDGRGNYKPSLLWYDAVDSYLRDFVQQDRCHSSHKRIKIDSDNEDSEEIPETKFNPSMLELVYNESSDNYNQNIKDSHESHSSLENNLQICENGLKRPEKMTEFDAFGCSVAAQLNSMPLVDALELQLKIQQLITTERLKRIKNEEG